jgi:paraquat-inducible protein B
MSGPAQTPDFEENQSFNLLTSIWIVPIIALIISAGLVYNYYSQLGSEIKLDFLNSYGLMPNESTIRFRDVVVGKITKIELQKDGEGVTVLARMSKEAEPYLTSSAKFWIVKPQVDYSGVKGLDTLIHGAYIEMHSPNKGKLRTHFRGLEKPYREKDQGMIVHLRTKKIGNIHKGAPVYYHNLQSGNIEDIKLSADRVSIDITVFINKKYAKMVNYSTKFWHQDLVAVNMENGRLGLNLAPLTSVLLGSINFDSKFDLNYPVPPSNYIFKLYDRYTDSIREIVGGTSEEPRHYRFIFAGKVNGLHEGVQIRYQGLKLGELDKVNIMYDPKNRSMKAETYGWIDSSVFRSKDHNGTYNLENAISKGLRAELQSSNPFFGELYIALDYPSKEENATQGLVAANGVVDFPTKRDVSNEVLSKLESLLNSFSDLANDTKQPLKDLLVKLNKSADNLNALMGKDSFKNLTDDLNSTLGTINSFTQNGGELDKAIVELRKTLKTTKSVMKGYSSGSLFGKKLEAMLKEVGKTSEETKRLIEKINKKPNSLIFGD